MGWQLVLGGSLWLRAGDRVPLLADADDLEPLTRLFTGTSEHTDVEVDVPTTAARLAVR